jgi:hypothetical protein
LGSIANKFLPVCALAILTRLTIPEPARSIIKPAKYKQYPGDAKQKFQENFLTDGFKTIYIA